LVKFVGIECAREALATELHMQLKEDGCFCYECYIAHRTLARSILRRTKDRRLASQVRRDLKIFDEHRKHGYDGLAPSIKRGIADYRAGMVMSEWDFLKKHPWVK